MNASAIAARRGRARATVLAVACLGALLAALAASGGARASTAGLVEVKGVPTLGLIAAKGEANSVDLTLEPGGKTFTLKDNGSRPDYSDVALRLAPDSLPGCVLVSEFDDPTWDYVRCERAKVKRVLVDLGDRDDWLANGDTLLDEGRVPVRVFGRGGKGADTLIGGNAADVLLGGPGKDIVTGGRGNDRLSGGAGVDSVSGDEQYILDKPPAKGGNDVLVGGAGKDYLYPGSGRDRVKGGAGNDIVGSVIDRDRDHVDCGAGKDSLLGVNNRGVRFAEKAVIGCESISNGIFGGLAWSCKKRRCTVTATGYSAREPERP